MEYKTLILIFPALILVELSQWFHAATNGWFVLKIKSYLEMTKLLPIITEKKRTLKSIRKVSDKEITRIYQGPLSVSGVKNPLLTHLLSPILNTYWKLVQYLI